MAGKSRSLSYNLPDIGIMESSEKFDSFVWQPDGTYIVLGRANEEELSVFSGNALKDNIRIYKRPSGGESVVLTPNMIVFSLKLYIVRLNRPRLIFEIINKHLIDSFKEIGVNNLESRGISDLSINNRKILGSSMYLKNNILFYHAVLNVKEDISIISKYLRHPKREPDYRAGRDHREFVTSMWAEGYKVDDKLLMPAIHKALMQIKTHFAVNIPAK
jgi:lipoate-protein ligase A